MKIKKKKAQANRIAIHCQFCTLSLTCSDSVKKLNQQNMTSINLFTINYCNRSQI